MKLFKINRPGRARLIGFFMVPFIIFAGIGFRLVPVFIIYAKEALNYGLVLCVGFCIGALLPMGKLQRWFLILFGMLIYFLAFVKLGFYYLYGVTISPSALFVIFETNKTEASEFLLNYLDAGILFIFMLLFIPYFVLVITWRKPQIPKYGSGLKYYGLIVSVLLVSLYSIHWKFKPQNLLLSSFQSYQEYKETKAKLKDQLAQPINPSITGVESNEGSQTFVVVIGESTSRWHMQLYGYKRETNPLLSEIKGELLVFDSVITPHVHTILALQKILTLADAENPDPKENASVVQLANQAGFATYWLSNQRPVGLHESISTLIGNAADHIHFMETDNYNSEAFDGVLLPKLDRILKDNKEKKLIFIHLIGTHLSYNKRYPENFEYFTGEGPIIKFRHKKAIELVNEYDNAVRYNDFIVRQIIETVRKTKTTSYVAYFSDHGDELFDTMDLMGHNEYHATRPMYEVPFVVWVSDKYKDSNSHLFLQSAIEGRSYSLEHFIHSFADLSNIKFDGLNLSKSIFSPTFKKRARLIKNNIDYDAR